ncbi:hypothetical protein [Streptomyces sp. NPDC053720]|uniref:ATP-binding protein n=1 Tax=Streptomyces sp. NPDC053720 TaxID=3154855 RepID=UPI00341FB50B
MILLDSTIVNVALPSLQSEPHMSDGDRPWVATAYTVAELVTIVVVHTTSDDVTLCLGVRDDVLKTEVRDRGYWRPADHDRPGPVPAHAECGRGLDIVAAYSGVPAVRATAAGTTVSTDLRLRSRRGTG